MQFVIDISATRDVVNTQLGVASDATDFVLSNMEISYMYAEVEPEIDAQILANETISHVIPIHE